MKHRMSWAIGLMGLVFSGCDKPVAKMPVQKMIHAEVVGVAANSITVHPLGRSGKEMPDLLSIGIDAQTTASTPRTTLDEATGRLLTVPMALGLADVHVADRIAVSTRDGVAVSIKVTPATARGELIRAGDGTITIRQAAQPGAAASEKTFRVEPGKTVVAWPKADQQTFEPRKLEELRGEIVAVSSMGGIAQMVMRVPPAPVQGRVKQADGDSITLAPTTRPGETARADERFAIDSAHTAFFEMYLGLAAARVAARDIRPEQAVTIVAKNGVAESVTIVHSPIHRKLISMESDAMVVNRNPQTPNERLTLTASTHYLVAKVMNTFAAPNGKTGYGFTYVDGRQTDLKPGDDLSITAKGSVALEVRRSFRAEQARAN